MPTGLPADGDVKAGAVEVIEASKPVYSSGSNSDHEHAQRLASSDKT